METDSGTYGDRIRKARNMLGLTQEELAEELDCNRTTIYHHENYETPPKDTSIAEALAERTGYSVDYFLGIEPTPKPIAVLNDNPSDHDLLRLLCSLGYTFEFISFSQVDGTCFNLTVAHFQTEGAILSFSSAFNLAIIDGIKTTVMIDSVWISRSESNQSSEDTVVSYTEFAILIRQITGIISHLLSPDRLLAESNQRGILSVQNDFLFESTPLGIKDGARLVETYKSDRKEQAKRRRELNLGQGENSITLKNK